jgi:dCMP deaminase
MDSVKPEEDGLYMRQAMMYAQRSKGIRAKVGALLVTANGVLLPGYNGTAPGRSNDLERVDIETGKLVTKTEVIHAELNCIIKAAREGICCKGSTVYVTLSPCEHCAALMLSCGVKRVVYAEVYKSENGINLLKESGVQVDNIKA